MFPENEEGSDDSKAAEDTQSEEKADESSDESAEAASEKENKEGDEEGEPGVRVTSFTDPKKIPKELKPYYDKLNATFTRKMQGIGAFVYGDKGVISYGSHGAGEVRIIPEAKMKEYKRPAKTLPRSPGHHRDWLNACKGGPKACSDFSYSARLAEMMLLGDAAIRTQKKIFWDGPNMKPTNAPEAEPFIREPYRDGWSLDTI